MILSHEGVFHSSSRVLGIDSDKFHQYVFTIVNLGFFFNVAVTVTAMCTTGLCREKLFKGASRRCCGKMFQCLMGPVAQSVFFLFALAFTIMFFVAFTVSVGTLTIGLFGSGACSIHVNATVVDSNPSSDISYALVKGESFIAPVLHRMHLPEMISKGVLPDDITNVCSAVHDLTSASRFAGISFGVLMFAQILFLIKIVHSFTTIVFDLSYDEPLNAQEVESLVRNEIDHIRRKSSPRSKRRHQARV